jgi:hypothetical protein
LGSHSFPFIAQVGPREKERKGFVLNGWLTRNEMEKKEEEGSKSLLDTCIRPSKVDGAKSHL